ncbi:MAG TPA: hypothetical protein VH478_00515, partial [Trebonia sp.]|nr:hypothetical protein [Trebonia sp.]
MTATAMEPGIVFDLTEPLDVEAAAASAATPGEAGAAGPSTGATGPGTAGGRVRLATSADLYRRWERQQWAVADVAPARDAARWQQLAGFSRGQVLGALTEFEVGEVVVTRTLGALLIGPPSEDDRIYLCTQLADEARHVKFFQAYLRDACGTAGAGTAGAGTDAGPGEYGTFFAPELTRVTGALLGGGASRADWYRALVYYHLMTEGVLGAAALRTMRFAARRLRLGALEEGITNVTRDESRHVSFGLRAAQQAVADGHGEAIAAAYLTAIAPAGRVLIGPSRPNPVPAMRLALLARAAQLQGEADIARDRVVRQLRLIGLPHLASEAGRAWDAAISRALDAYADRW